MTQQDRYDRWARGENQKIRDRYPRMVPRGAAGTLDNRYRIYVEQATKLGEQVKTYDEWLGS